MFSRVLVWVAAGALCGALCGSLASTAFAEPEPKKVEAKKAAGELKGAVKKAAEPGGASASGSASASKTPTSQPAPAPGAVTPPKTDANATAAAYDLVKSLKDHRWWFAAALGIYIALFLLGRFKLFDKIGTFWAWVGVALLSLAAGFFAACDQTGFNWKTFLEYATAGPTVAYLRDFFKDVVLLKLKSKDKADPAAGASGVIGCLLLGLVIAASGCMSTEKALIKIQAGTASLRQEGTTYFDSQCLAVAMQCPKGPADKCAVWVKCKDKRKTFYAGTNGIQLMVAAGLNLVGIDREQEAKSILLQVTSAVLDLHQKLKSMQVYEAAFNMTKLFGDPIEAPASAPVPVPVPVPVPASAPAGGVR